VVQFLAFLFLGCDLCWQQSRVMRRAYSDRQQFLPQAAISAVVGCILSN
jgi:hypothetical protein